MAGTHVRAGEKEGLVDMRGSEDSVAVKSLRCNAKGNDAQDGFGNQHALFADNPTMLFNSRSDGKKAKANVFINIYNNQLYF